MNEFVVRGFLMACGMAIFCGLCGVVFVVIAGIIRLISEIDYKNNKDKFIKKAGC